MRWRMWITIACAAGVARAGDRVGRLRATAVDVSAATTNDVFPQVATDADGRSVVVWKETSANGNVLRFRRVRPDGSMGVTTTLSDDSMLRDPVPRGAWPRPGAPWRSGPRARPASSPASCARAGSRSTTRSARRSPCGTRASRRPSTSPALATTTDGDAVVAWRNSRSTPAGKVEARRVGAAGTLGPLLPPTEGPNVGRASGSRRTRPGRADRLGRPSGHRGDAGRRDRRRRDGRDTGGGGRPGSPRLSTGGQGAFHLLWIAQGPPAGLTTLTSTRPAPRPEAPARSTATAASSRASGSRQRRRPLARVLGPRRRHRRRAVLRRRRRPPGKRPHGARRGAVHPRRGRCSATAAHSPSGPRARRASPGPCSAARSRRTDRGRAGRAVPVRPTRRGFAATPGRHRPGRVAAAHAAERQPVQVRARQLLPPPVCPDAAAHVVQGRPRPSPSLYRAQLTAPRC